MPLLKVSSGNVNLRQNSGQVRVLHTPHKGGKGNKEVWLDKASKEGPTTAVIRRVGIPRLYASVPGRDSAIAGLACDQTFDIDEGEVIKVFVDVRASFGERPTRANVFLRIRAEAAHRVVEFGITNHASAEFTKGVIEGTFDVLTLTEAIALGVVIAPHNRALSSPKEVAKAITLNTVLREEIAPLARLEAKTVVVGGKAREIVQQVRPRRRIGGA